MMSLLELAERCEAAEGSDSNLDWAIINAINPDERWTYTGSIDAAARLVPEGWGWNLDSGGYAVVLDWGNGPKPRIGGRGATPALALCAAALRARAAIADTPKTRGET